MSKNDPGLWIRIWPPNEIRIRFSRKNTDLDKDQIRIRLNEITVTGLSLYTEMRDKN